MDLLQFAKQIDEKSLCFYTPRTKRLARCKSYNGACPKRTRETRCFGVNLFTELINGTVFVKAGKVSMRRMKEESDE